MDEREFDKICPPIIGDRCAYCGKDAVFAHGGAGHFPSYVAWCSNCAHPATNVAFTMAGSRESAIRRWNRQEH